MISVARPIGDALGPRPNPWNVRQATKPSKSAAPFEASGGAGRAPVPSRRRNTRASGRAGAEPHTAGGGSAREWRAGGRAGGAAPRSCAAGRAFFSLSLSRARTCVCACACAPTLVPPPAPPPKSSAAAMPPHPPLPTAAFALRRRRPRACARGAGRIFNQRRRLLKLSETQIVSTRRARGSRCSTHAEGAQALAHAAPHPPRCHTAPLRVGGRRAQPRARAGEQGRRGGARAQRAAQRPQRGHGGHGDGCVHARSGAARYAPRVEARGALLGACAPAGGCLDLLPQAQICARVATGRPQARHRAATGAASASDARVCMGERLLAASAPVRPEARAMLPSVAAAAPLGQMRSRSAAPRAL